MDASTITPSSGTSCAAWVTPSSPPRIPRSSASPTPSGAPTVWRTSTACSPSPSSSTSPDGWCWLGIKPLYISQSGDRIPFASTLPALLAAGDVDTSIDRVALQYYMTFHSVVPAPHTILNGIRKLPPATVRIVEADGRTRDIAYWEPPFERDHERSRWSGHDWQEALIAALRTSVKRRQVADVPVGVLLSGGIDSSLVVALLAEAGQHDLQTFSVGFDDAGGESGNEFEYSDLVAAHFGTDHHRIK